MITVKNFQLALHSSSLTPPSLKLNVLLSFTVFLFYIWFGLKVEFFSTDQPVYWYGKRWSAQGVDVEESISLQLAGVSELIYPWQKDAAAWRRKVRGCRGSLISALHLRSSEVSRARCTVCCNSHLKRPAEAFQDSSYFPTARASSCYRWNFQRCHILFFPPSEVKSFEIRTKTESLIDFMVIRFKANP